MAFFLIMPSTATGYERIFILVTLWAHPHWTHCTTLVDVACKLMLLKDGSTNWVHTFVLLNEVLSQAPLSSMGHISTMTDGAPSTDACSCLHQGGVSRRPQWPDGSLTIHLQRASPLECHCSQQICLQTAANGSGPWWHAVWHHKQLPFRLHTLCQSYLHLLQTPLSLLMTPLQLSTCSSWLPWSDYSRLPPLPQPPFPSAACQGNSHHLPL